MTQSITKRFAAALSMMLILIFCSSFDYFQHSLRQEIKHFNMKYGDDPKQKLDIYTASREEVGKRHPVIIYVHGGSWVGGDKFNVAEKPAYFTNKGYVFVSVNYRLAPEVNYNQMAADVSTAVKWIYDHAGLYLIDHSRINLMGHSAGGHLVTLIGTNPKFLKSAGLPKQAVKSVIDLEGPIDLTELIQKNGIYKKVFGNDKKVWAEASPVTYAGNQNLPPLLFVGRKDKSLAAFIGANRNTSDFFECKTLSHREITGLLGSSQAPVEARNMTNAVEAFLKRYNF